MPELGLGPGVLVVGLSLLGRVVVGLERLDLPTLESATELAQLAWIARGELCPQGFQRAPLTACARVRASISSAAECPRSIRTRRSTRLLSPSSSNSSERTIAPAPSTAPITETALAPAGRSTARRPSSGLNRSDKRYAKSRRGHRLKSTSTVVIA